MSAAQIQPPLLRAVSDRIDSLNWPAIHQSLRASGWARTGKLLSAEECRSIRDLYADDARFRSKVVMARHRFGLGEYKYFSAPLPRLVVELRESFYSHLVPVANEWSAQLGTKAAYPERHRDFIAQCHERGQVRPTPLLLRYERGGYNCLHQDLYGEIYFPLQTVFLLDQPEADFNGGEFVLVEQRPRAQSSAQVIAPQQGEAVIFTTRWRPVQGTRGHYRVNIKHGVSAVTGGIRHTLGIVYHDAE